MEGASELCQQSIAESTHFFSTTDIFGRNTPFSARFRNSLTLKRLCSLRIAQHSTFNSPHYKTCLFAMRNTPNGGAIRYLSQLERCLPASGSHVFVASIPQKRPFRSLVHAKIRHNFLTKNPDRFIHCSLSTQSPCHCPGRRSSQVGKHGTDPMLRPPTQPRNGQMVAKIPQIQPQIPIIRPMGRGYSRFFVVSLQSNRVVGR